MSVYNTILSYGCTSWYQLYKSTNLITYADATIIGTLSSYWLKNGGLAGKFSGSNYITSTENLPTQDFTIIIKINQTVTATSSNVNTIYENSNSGHTSYISIYVDTSNYVNVYLKNGSTIVTLKSLNPIKNFTWYNIVVRHTSSGCNLIVDTDSVSGAAITLDIVNQTYTAIGCKAIAYTDIFTGYMKNLLIFNDDLSDKQIQKLYYLTYIN